MSEVSWPSTASAASGADTSSGPPKRSSGSGARRLAARGRPIVFLGPDPNGVMLEVVAVELEHGLLIIHAIKMRSQYRPFLKRKGNA